MEKNEFLFWFPESKTTINVVASPLIVKDIAEKYLKRQDFVLGSLCVIKSVADNEIIAVACYHSECSRNVRFFTEDTSIQSVVDIDSYYKIQGEDRGGTKND